jgi:hypothetical protein
MESVLKTILVLVMFGFLVGVSLIGMVWGWGLEAKNWGWVAFSYLLLLFPSAMQVWK